MSIFIGGAWAYANGSLHLGHVSSLLPGDILARYYRLKGEKVLYASGSDCNGTPITVKARQAGVEPRVIADYYHQEFVDCFTRLGFSYDIYTRTDTAYHHQVVQKIFLTLLEKGLIDKRSVEQTYCGHCQQFLPDRYVEGICPVCSEPARGDQCDHCATILEPLELHERSCKICGHTPTTRETEHFYFALSALQSELEQFTQRAEEQDLWRENALQLTKRYLREGLQDRAISRDLPIGVSVPVAGYEDKKVYVWIEAVSGYFSASKKWAEKNNVDDSPFWSDKVTSYYIHGKDNIPFHTVIWPAILKGIGVEALPTRVISNEYVTLEKKKLSTSKNWAVWIPDLLERYNPDSLRYFLTINAPENRDADFSWKEFIYSHNSELLGAYGNFVNRTLKFIEKSFAGVIQTKDIAEKVKNDVNSLYAEVGNHIEQGSMKKALENLFDYVRKANKYFDEEKPWQQWHENREACEKTLATCVYMIANLAQLLSPFLPFSSKKVFALLNVKDCAWKEIVSNEVNLTTAVEPLFERIGVENIEIEVERLQAQAHI